MESTKSNRKRILFVASGYSSFVRNDYQELSKVHSIQKYHFLPVKGILKNGWQMLRQFGYLLCFGWKFDLFYCWFADYHSFLPVLFAKIFRKRSVVVIGGYDVCRIRDLNYGAFCSPFRGWFSARSMQWASMILPVSRQVERKAARIAPKTPRSMIYNCLTLDNPPSEVPRKTDTILTVGLIDNERTFYLKGIDTFIETARLLPGFQFEIIGINRYNLSRKLGNLPNNLSLFEKVEHHQLTRIYQNAKVYCQLSRSESFGVSILEAMTFGCLPIVTQEGGMPEVVGPFGLLVKRDPIIIADLIKTIILKDQFPAPAAIHEHIEKLFSRKLRTNSLLMVINNL